MKQDEKYKDSGVEWIGEIPVGWEVKKLMHFIERLGSDVGITSTDFPKSDNIFGILKTSCVYNYQFDPNESKEIWQPKIERAKINPQECQLRMSRMNTPELVGPGGYIKKTHANSFLPDRLWQTKPFSGVSLTPFWTYLLIPIPVPIGDSSL